MIPFEEFIDNDYTGILFKFMPDFFEQFLSHYIHYDKRYKPDELVFKFLGYKECINDTEDDDLCLKCKGLPVFKLFSNDSIVQMVDDLCFSYEKDGKEYAGIIIEYEDFFDEEDFKIKL